MRVEVNDLVPTRTLRNAAVLAIGAVVALGAASCGDDSEVPAPSNGPAPSADVPASKVAYRLSAAGDMLLGPGKQRIPVREGAVTGYGDSIGTAGETVYVNGWAATGSLGQPADRVVGIVGDAGIASAKVSEERPDVAEINGNPALRRSGFVLSFTKPSLDCSQTAGGLTIFGIVDGQASALTWAESSPELISEKAC